MLHLLGAVLACRLDFIRKEGVKRSGGAKIDCMCGVKPVLHVICSLIHG